MQAFTKHTGVAVVLDSPNIDTDQIIPKQFLKRIERTGYGDFLFFDQRYLADGSPNPAFVLNAPAAKGASVLIAGPNFGCGSSREHAVWALSDYGFRAVIAPSFADIFANNSFQNGLLTITMSEQEIAAIRSALETASETTIDLEAKTVRVGNQPALPFRIDEFRRDCLLRGLDEIGRTLLHEDQITSYERTRPAFKPVVGAEPAVGAYPFQG
jgi:3-isopropylmalate/(R)-2-methylmalate dehydratase small subunit